jgi:large repetitive protein
VNRARGTLRFLGRAAVLVALVHPAFSQQLSISPTSLPDGIINQPYVDFGGISINNAGATTWTWAISKGALPPGVGLVPGPNAQPFADFTGTPTAVGSYSFTVQATENFAPALVTVTHPYTIQIAGKLTVTTSTLAQGTVGTQYMQQLQATGGIPPYTWLPATFSSAGSHQQPAARSGRGRARPAATTSGSLPPGLILSSSGQITGMPTQVGSYTFDVTVSDSSSTASQSTGGTFTITVATPNPLAITTPSLPGGTVGTPYSIPLRAQGGEIPYVWTITSGTLPPGLQVGSGGSLTGTPTQAGNFTFTLMVTDFSGQTASVTVTIIIASAFSITTPSPLPPGTVGVAYSEQINVTPTAGPYTFTFSAAASSPLPGWLSLAPTSTTPASVLSGTPTAAGSFTFTIIAADSANHTASQTYTLVIAPPPITIAPATLPNGTLGTAYSQQLTATGGAGGYVFSVGSGAAPGIGLSSSGLLGGTPTAAGAFSFTVTVTDSKQTTVTQTYQLTITAPPVKNPTVTGVGSTAPPAQQPTVSVQLAQSYPTDLTGTITLTFTPAAGNEDDPSIQFSTGGRTVTFTIPAGQTTAVFSAATISLGTGTVAGTITLTLDFKANGQDVTPQPAPKQVIIIGPQAPVITKVTVSSTSGGIEVDVTGFSNTREMVNATFTFQAASGTTLQGSTATITVDQIFAAWYNGTSSTQYGSQFTFAQPFTISGSANGIASVSVTLSNKQGTSPATTTTVP